MKLNFYRSLVIMGAIIFVPGFSSALTMTIEKNCGISNDQLQVIIWIPPGGVVNVNADGTVNLPENVARGTKVHAYYNDDDNRLYGPWTLAVEGGILPVQCKN